ncbi:hypothetical protein J3R74_000438 [Puniceicoccus vermicola]
MRASSSLTSDANRELEALATFSSPPQKPYPGNPARVVRASSSLPSDANREQDALATFSSPPQKAYLGDPTIVVRASSSLSLPTQIESWKLSLPSLHHRKRPTGQSSQSSESFQLSHFRRKSRAGCSRYLLFPTAKALPRQPSQSSESFQLSPFPRKSRAGCSRYLLFTTAKGLPGNPAEVVRASSSLPSHANRELEALATLAFPFFPRA